MNETGQPAEEPINIFKLTAEQMRYWNIMEDEELFPDEQGHNGMGRSSDSEKDPRFEAAYIEEEHTRRLHYFRKTKKGDGKFYSLGGTARSVKKRCEYDYDHPANQFMGEVEKSTFDDCDLVTVLNKMQRVFLDQAEDSRRAPDAIGSNSKEAESFILGDSRNSPSYSDGIEKIMFQYSKALLSFQQVLYKLRQKLILYREAMITHPLFGDLDKVIEQIDAVKRICDDSVINTSLINGCITVKIPEEYLSSFPKELHEIEISTSNIYTAKALFLHHLGLVPHIKYYFALASLIDYVEHAAALDSEVIGVYPEIVKPDEDGLVLDVEGFSHPAIYRGKNIQNHFKDIYRTLGNEVIDGLEREHLFGRHKDEKGDSGYFWEQGVTKQSVEEFIRTYKLDMTQAETLMHIYQNSVYVPATGIHLDARNRIQLVTGANFDGKSTYMQAVGYLFHKAATARKFIANRARISLPDMVYDDFDINANRQYDIASECSTFSTQVKKVVEFIERATPRSIGLFDELYHGTSAPYLLSLGWATIEKFEELGLYAIISTHEPLLTRYTEEGGYESLKGKYYRPPHGESELRETTVTNVSLQGGYHLKQEPVTDSDAFRVARQEGMPEKVMARAQEVLRHITSKNGR